MVAQEDQAPSPNPINIRWGHSALEVLSLGEEFSRCRHLESRRELDILTDYLRQGPAGPYCLDSTDYLLPVQAGDRLAIVRRTSRGALAKKGRGDRVVPGENWGQHEPYGRRCLPSESMNPSSASPSWAASPGLPRAWAIPSPV